MFLSLSCLVVMPFVVAVVGLGVFVVMLLGALCSAVADLRFCSYGLHLRLTGFKG